MANSARHSFPFLEISQQQKETTHNEALRIVDVLANALIIDRDLSTPPGSPSNGDLYIVAATGTGDWAGQDGNLAFYYDGWTFITPFEGFNAWVDDEERQIVYSDNAFREATTSLSFGVSSPAVTTDQIILSNTDAGTLKLVDSETDGAFVLLPQASTVDDKNIVGIKKSNDDDSRIIIHGFTNNLLLHSNDQNNVVWNLSRVTINTNTGTDPDGGTTLDKIEETTDNGVHEIDQEHVKPFGVTTLTFRIVAQADERDTIVLAVDRGSSTHRAEARYDLSTNTISNTASNGDAAYVNSSISDLPNSNKLLTLTVTVTADENTWETRIRLYNGTTTYTGVLTEGLYIGRAQLVYGSIVPDYVETTTAPSIETIDGDASKVIRSKNSSLIAIKSNSAWQSLNLEQSFEEGTWTPTLRGATVAGSQTYGDRIGYYTRRGAFVDFLAQIEVTTLDGATSGNLEITGLPFAVVNNAEFENPVTIHPANSVTLSINSTQIAGKIGNNSSIIQIIEFNTLGGAEANVQATNISSGFKVRLYGTIRIN